MDARGDTPGWPGGIGRRRLARGVLVRAAAAAEVVVAAIVVVVVVAIVVVIVTIQPLCRRARRAECLCFVLGGVPRR
jgi:hypothetical protein